MTPSLLYGKVPHPSEAHVPPGIQKHLQVAFKGETDLFSQGVSRF